MSTPISSENRSSKRVAIRIRLCLRASEVQHPNIGHEIFTISIVLYILNHSFATPIFVVFGDCKEGIIEMARSVAECEYFELGDYGVGEIG